MECGIRDITKLIQNIQSQWNHCVRIPKGHWWYRDQKVDRSKYGTHLLEVVCAQ